MKKGELEYATRKALNHFDEWVDATGVVPKGTSYYFEMQGVIEDAVKIGSIIATYGMSDDCGDAKIEEIINEFKE